MSPTICLAELSMQQNRSAGVASSRSNCVRRRQRNINSNISKTVNSNSIISKNGAIREDQRLIEIRRIFNDSRDVDLVDSLSPPASPVWEQPTCPFLPTVNNSRRNSIPNSNISGAVNYHQRNSQDLNCSQRWRSILARREGLLDIAARTMALVRRSHILQKRVNALRYETREFVRSVLSNPENNNNGGKELTGCEESQGMIPCGYVSSSSSSSSFSNSEISLLRPITPPPTPDSSTESEHIVIDDEINDSSLSRSIINFERNDSSDDIEELEFDSDNKVTQDPMVSSS